MPPTQMRHFSARYWALRYYLVVDCLNPQVSFETSLSAKMKGQRAHEIIDHRFDTENTRILCLAVKNRSDFYRHKRIHQILRVCIIEKQIGGA